MQTFSNSPLVVHTNLSPNCRPRTQDIDMITIHCMAGNASIEVCGQIFKPESRQASSNYGVGSDGRIGLYVEEKNRSWCTSSTANDNRAVTIEVANITGAPDWKISDKALQALKELCLDICKRNNIKELKFRNDKNLFGNIELQNMSLHRWFAAKACPGQDIINKHTDIIEYVNKRLGDEINMTKEEFIDSLTEEEANKIYLKGIQKYKDNDSSDWSKEDREWAIKEKIINGYNDNYRWEDTITREEAIALIHRLYKKIEEK